MPHTDSRSNRHLMRTIGHTAVFVTRRFCVSPTMKEPEGGGDVDQPTLFPHNYLNLFQFGFSRREIECTVQLVEKVWRIVLQFALAADARHARARAFVGIAQKKRRQTP